MAHIIRGAPTPIFFPFLKSTPNNFDCRSYFLLKNYAPNLSPHQSKPYYLSSSLSSRLNYGVRDQFWYDNDSPTTTAAAYDILGVEPHCSAAQLKAAFRAKWVRKPCTQRHERKDQWVRKPCTQQHERKDQVKEFHPDVRSNQHNSDLMIRRVIQAYETLSDISRSEIIESECLDPFDNPECEAFDIFVNEVVCAGKGCPYSCVKQASHAFSFSSLGTAHATYQGAGYNEDYRVQIAVGQCPRNCIHYVTPSQRIILEELLDSILNTPYDTSAEADLLYYLIIKAKFENNRYQKPKKQPKTSTEHVDWF